VFHKYIRLILIAVLGLISWNAQAQISDFDTNIMMYQVSLVGAVDNPGVFLVPASTRVSEVIKLSQTQYFEAEMRLKSAGQTLELEEENLFDQKYKDFIFDPNKKAIVSTSQRNIVLKRKNQEIQVDLQKFFTLGIDQMNPYVMDGDVIFVPSRNNEVSLSGAVNKEGSYELVKGERISDIIELALGCQESAYLQEVELIRFNEYNQTETIVINLENAMSHPGSEDNIILQSGDRIYIRSIPQFHENKFVNVAGNVDYPGLYPIIEGETTLLNILQKCGINIEEVNFDKAFVQRADLDVEFDPEFERLKLMVASNMKYLEYAYFKQKCRDMKAKSSVDMKMLWETKDEKYDVVLRDKDFIYLPPATKTVFVSGQVVNPGYITIEAGMNFEYYIEKAGGLTNMARKGKIRIIKPDTGEWIKPNKEMIIEDGDIIFIPEESEFDTWQFALDALRVVSTVASIFYTITYLMANY
jgi:protein involved in polysaccharide export with SLBB domain